MKSNRTRLTPPATTSQSASEVGWYISPDGPEVPLEKMPAPINLPSISPEQIVEDILVSTLLRVKRSSSPEVAAAAERYLLVLKNEAEHA